MNLIRFFILFSVIIGFAQSSDKLGHEKWEYALESSGDILQIGLPLAAGITTIIKKDWKGTKQFALSYGTTIIFSHTLKKIVRKQRPEGRVLFDSFPSAHTSSAFSGASFIQRRYGWKYGKYAYLLATVVGVSRMEGPDGWHDGWDVLGGAVIGIGSTYLFTKPINNKNISFNFNLNNETFIFNLAYTF